MKLCTIVGARPQFIKAASLSAELRRHHEEILVHTGQHYDYEMSRVFFEELEIPVPDYNLGVGSGSHGAQTGAMLAGIEDVLLKERPDLVVVIGDTNSTLAGALAGAKLNLPVAHVEAGLRSYRRTMPEEINRVMADHLSTWLFCPTETAVKNLEKEGLRKGVQNTGDVLYDSLSHALPVARSSAGVRGELGVAEHSFALVTLHRAENTDDSARLESFARALLELGMPVVFPVHPRARAALVAAGLWELLGKAEIKLIEPVGYTDCLRLTDTARVVITDSGGLQREATALGVPCVVAREETEWVEALEDGRTVLAGGCFRELPEAVGRLLNGAGKGPRPAIAERAGASLRIRQMLEGKKAQEIDNG
jgi:UDP-N-acetylglucosamine 2-epimerase